MTSEDVLAKFAGLHVWSRGAQRAPHKPLLVLHALGKRSRGEPARVPFREIDERLTPLLKEFGPPRQAHHPEYPFHRLQNDGVWRLDDSVALESRKGNVDPKKSELLNHDVHGGFTDDVLAALSENPRLATDIAQQLLDSHFPESLHSEILGAVGLSLERTAAARKARDPRFRERVLTAYERRCAVCEFDVRLGDTLVALDAAHIKWHQASGPDEEANGLALCVLHHKVFDLGAFTVRPDGLLLVSEQVSGTSGMDETLLRFHGQAIREPQRPEHRPKPEFLEWHETEVFKGKPRHLAGV